jgi:hypothetical protein
MLTPDASKALTIFEVITAIPGAMATGYLEVAQKIWLKRALTTDELFGASVLMYSLAGSNPNREVAIIKKIGIDASQRILDAMYKLNLVSNRAGKLMLTKDGMRLLMNQAS